MTTRRNLIATAGASLLAAGCTSTVTSNNMEAKEKAAATLTPQARAALVQQVTDAENAFAKTIVDRDFDAFLSFIAEECIFLNGGSPLRGRKAIGDFWKRFYTGPNPPFTWKPDLVEVLDSGNLAQSIGPVANPNGVVNMRFYSTWRLEGDGKWRVVFDDGYTVCVKT
jgi:ketosteroid isomerase-like protein